EPREIDVRFVSATNRDLEAESDRGSFRRDLYYRLNGMTLRIPPLRDRIEEILPLAESFAERIARQIGRSGRIVFSEAAVDALEAHPWPGNIRELKNTVERAVVLSDGAPIEVEHLSLGPGAAKSPGPVKARGTELRSELEEIEKKRILEA